jgi:hypothetical protein
MSTPPAPNFDRVPDTVARVLLPHERQIITARLHPAVLIVPTVLGIGGLIGASVLSFLNLSGDALAITWSAWALAFLYLLWQVTRWLESYFVVTAQRILTVRGLPSYDVAMLPLAYVANLRFRRSLLGRILGYGQFILDHPEAGRGIRSVNFVPYPEQLLLEISGLIYKDRGDDE